MKCEEEWAEEIRRRLEAWERGEAKAISVEELLTRLHEVVGGHATCSKHEAAAETPIAAGAAQAADAVRLSPREQEELSAALADVQAGHFEDGLALLQEITAAARAPARRANSRRKGTPGKDGHEPDDA